MTKAGPDRAIKQRQEETSPNHLQTIISGSVCFSIHYTSQRVLLKMEGANRERLSFVAPLKDTEAAGGAAPATAVIVDCLDCCMTLAFIFIREVRWV